MTDRVEWVRVGTHRLRMEPPDTLHLIWNGEVKAEQVLTVGDYLESLKQPRLFVVNVLTRSAMPSPQTRNHIAKDKRVRLVHAMACVGASRSIQVTINLLLRAATFFLNAPEAKMTFVTTEAEARAWLEAQRMRLEASSPV